VDGENIHGIVDSHRSLESCTQVRDNGGNDTNKSTSGRTTESSGGSDGDKSSDGTGTETDNGPLSLKSEIHKQPCERTGRSSEIGVEDGECCLERSGETRSTVESEPSDPEEDCTEYNLTDVGGLEDDSVGTPSSSFTDKVRVGET